MFYADIIYDPTKNINPITGPVPNKDDDEDSIPFANDPDPYSDDDFDDDD